MTTLDLAWECWRATIATIAKHGTDGDLVSVKLDEAARLIDAHIAEREAALVERIIGAVIGFYDLGFSPGQDVDLIAAIREAARRKE